MAGAEASLVAAAQVVVVQGVDEMAMNPMLQAAVAALDTYPGSVDQMLRAALEAAPHTPLCRLANARLNCPGCAAEVLLDYLGATVEADDEN